MSVPAAGGLAGALHRSSAGAAHLGLRHHGAGRPRGGGPGPDARGRPRPRPGRRRRRHVPPGLRRGRQRDVVVLPPPSLRPPRSGPASTVTGTRPGRATAPTTGPSPTSWPSEAGEGDAVLVQDYHLSLAGPDAGPAPARPAHRPLLPHPLRRPDHVAACSPTTGRRAARRHGRLRRLRVPQPRAGRRPSAACYADAARARSGRHRPTFVAPLGPDARARSRRGRLARPPVAAAEAPAGRDRRPAHRGPGRPDRAVEEHPAGHAGPSRSCSRPIPSGAARWCSWPWLSLARGAGRVPRATAPRWSTRPSGSTSLHGVCHTGAAWTPIVLSVTNDDRARSLAALSALPTCCS